jgi:hypothetical protein
MADFDAAAEFQLPLPSGDGSPATTLRKSATSVRLRQVAAEIDAGQVEAGFVGAADEVAHRRHAAVGENRHVFASTATGPM